MMEVFAGLRRARRLRDGPDHRRGASSCPTPTTRIFIYIAGDNGASAEGGLEGSVNENLFFNGFPEKWQDNLKAIDELGGPKHFNHFPSAWAHAMDTPFQWTKQVASHFGGTRNPLIVSWPARIKDQRRPAHAVPPRHRHRADALRGDRHHAARRSSTASSRSRSKASASPTRSTTPRPRAGATTQYFEMGVNRGHLPRRLDGVGRRRSSPWQPNRGGFDPDKRSGSSTTSTRTSRRPTTSRARIPQKLRELQDLWWVEAAKYNVLPLDWRAVERLNAELMGRPSLGGQPQDVHLLPRHRSGCRTMPRRRILNKSWTLTADIEVPEGGAEGMIVTHGGLVGGYGLYVRDGKPTFVYNYLALDRFTMTGQQPLPKGKVQLKVDFAYKGGGRRARQRRGA